MFMCDKCKKLIKYWNKTDVIYKFKSGPYSDFLNLEFYASYCPDCTDEIQRQAQAASNKMAIIKDEI